MPAPTLAAQTLCLWKKLLDRSSESFTPVFALLSIHFPVHLQLPVMSKDYCSFPEDLISEKSVSGESLADEALPDESLPDESSNESPN
jgi:hypothetical protein